MLTLFTTCKPFEGNTAIIQRNALQSWKLLHPDVEIILFGDEPGVAEVCSEFGLRHEPRVERHESGLKYLDYIFVRAQEIARHDCLCYSNCDMIFMADFRTAFEKVLAWRERFLMIGHRWDTNITRALDFTTPAWQSDVLSCVRETGNRQNDWYIDYFAFRRGLYTEIPPFVIGRVGWDNWLVWKAHSAKAAVVNVSPVLKAIHQNHDYSYHPAGAHGVWNDELALRNREFCAGGVRMLSIADATYKLDRSGIRRVLSSWAIFRRSRLWAAHWRIAGYLRPRIWHPLLDVTRNFRHALGLRRSTTTARPDTSSGSETPGTHTVL